MNKSLLLYLVFILFVFFMACQNQSESNPEQENESVILTEEQFNGEGMVLANLSEKEFDRTISCNGIIKAPSEDIAIVSTHISGFVKSIHCNFGDYVVQGQELFRVTSNELINLQQAYAESITELNRLSIEYDRETQLKKEGIGSQKDYVAIESNFKVMAAQCESLKLQLMMLDLSVDDIAKGKFYASYSVKAPIGGYITQYEVMKGEFVEQTEELIEIVNNQNLWLELSVFESDVAYLHEGQTVLFKTLGSDTTTQIAKIIRIGKSVNDLNKSISCTAVIESKKGKYLINGSFVQAQVIVDTKKVKALPNDAIIAYGNKHFVFVVEKSSMGNYQLNKVNVTLGSKTDDYTEITMPKTLENVIVKGVYNLTIE